MVDQRGTVGTGVAGEVNIEKVRPLTPEERAALETAPKGEPAPEVPEEGGEEAPEVTPEGEPVEAPAEVPAEPVEAPAEEPPAPDVEAPAEEEPVEEEQVESSFDPSEHSVAEVQQYIQNHPEEKDAIIAAEQAGKARVTILNL